MPYSENLRPDARRLTSGLAPLSLLDTSRGALAAPLAAHLEGDMKRPSWGAEEMKSQN